MATYYIYRKDIPGTLSTSMLQEYARAFRVLYCNPLTPGSPKLEIRIRGTWITGFKDGLFLKDSYAIVTDIGRKYVTVKHTELGITYKHQIELTPNRIEGFSEIMFIDVFR